MPRKHRQFHRTARPLRVERLEEAPSARGPESAPGSALPASPIPESPPRRQIRRKALCRRRSSKPSHRDRRGKRCCGSTHSFAPAWDRSRSAPQSRPRVCCCGSGRGPARSPRSNFIACRSRGTPRPPRGTPSMRMRPRNPDRWRRSRCPRATGVSAAFWEPGTA